MVLAQAANAFACRSSTRWPGSLGWATNRLLGPAVAAGVAVALTTLFVPAIAAALGQASPPVAGWVVAVAGMGVILAVDAVDKAIRRARIGRAAAVVSAGARA